MRNKNNVERRCGLKNATKRVPNGMQSVERLNF
jgi:hypothetical protein